MKLPRRKFLHLALQHGACKGAWASAPRAPTDIAAFSDGAENGAIPSGA
jgi:hypothetical protein